MAPNDVRPPTHHGLGRGRQDEARPRERGYRECRRFDRNEDLHPRGPLGFVAERDDRVIRGPAQAGRYIRIFALIVVVSGVSRTMRVAAEMRVDRGRTVMIAVIVVRVRMEEWCGERAHLQRHAQTRGDNPTHHPCIVPTWRRGVKKSELLFRKFKWFNEFVAE